MAANLTVRARVNWMSNYDVLHAGFNELEKEHGNNRLFTEAVDWWMEIKGLALEKIQSVYVTKSRNADNLVDYSYGLLMMGDKIRDQEIPWTTLMSHVAQKDLTDFFNASSGIILTDCSVDDAMAVVVLLMTERMAITWVFVMLMTGQSLPEKSVFDNYFTNSLDGNFFPNIPNDEDVCDLVRGIIKFFTVHINYDGSGAPIIAALLAADDEERSIIHNRLNTNESLLSAEDREKVMCIACKGKTQDEILDIFAVGYCAPADAAPAVVTELD